MTPDDLTPVESGQTYELDGAWVHVLSVEDVPVQGRPPQVRATLEVSRDGRSYVFTHQTAKIGYGASWEAKIREATRAL